MDKLKHLFFLLPEYEDKEIQHTPFTNLYKDDSDWNDIATEVGDLLELFELFEHENLVGFYDDNNLQNFLFPFQIMEDEYYAKEITRIRRLVFNYNLTKWEEGSVQVQGETYTCSFEDVKNHVYGEVAKRKLLEPNMACVVVNPKESKKQVIEVNPNGREVIIEQTDGNIKLFSQWLVSNRDFLREFKVNPKHGENGSGKFRDNKGLEVSGLLCSRLEAQELLHLAICTTTNKLFYYDVNHAKYIVFHSEGNTPQHTYHGYHIDNENDVPSNIRKKISRILKRSE